MRLASSWSTITSKRTVPGSVGTAARPCSTTAWMNVSRCRGLTSNRRIAPSIVPPWLSDSDRGRHSGCHDFRDDLLCQKPHRLDVLRVYEGDEVAHSGRDQRAEVRDDVAGRPGHRARGE